MLETLIAARVDLNARIEKTFMNTIFVTEDNLAHKIDVQLYRGDEQVILPSDAAVTAYFIRNKDNSEEELDGTASGNTVSVTLEGACYNQTGQFSLVIKAMVGEEISTVFYGEGTVTFGGGYVPTGGGTNTGSGGTGSGTGSGDYTAYIDSEITRQLNWAKNSGEFDGEDGFSPTVTLTRLSSGVQITATNKTGIQTAMVYDGTGGTGSTTTDETIPTYWKTHLDARVKDIRAAMASAGVNKSAFLFYTDAHWTYGNQKSPMLLKYLYQHTPINRTIFGGDIVDNEGDDTTTMAYLWDWREQVRDLPNHHSVPGNHDDGNSIDARWNDAYIYTFLQAAEETPDVVRGDSGLYYHIDVPAEKTRYLYLDTATRNGSILYNTAHQAWLKETLKGTPEGWHIIAIGHIWRDTNYTVSPPVPGGWNESGKYCLDQFDAYNARTGEYAACKGKVELCIGGHTHVDGDYYSDGGILVILTECDSMHVRSGLSCTAGTTTEASVNAIVADYANEKVSVIRIGRGSSRVAALLEGGDTGGEEPGGGDGTDTPTTPDGTYTNQLTIAKDTDGSIYNGKGYKENTRISTTSYNESSANGWYLTGFIPATKGDVIRFKNMTFIDINNEADQDRAVIYYYYADHSYFSNSEMYSPEKPMEDIYEPVYGENGDVIQFMIPASYTSTIAYIRICAKHLDQYSVITVNEAFE